MAYSPPRTAEQFEAMRAWMARSVAQSSMAFSQVVVDRMVRMMGSLRPDTPQRQERLLLLAHRLVSVCEAFLMSYYMPEFALYWRLRTGHEKNSEDTKVYKLTKALMHFGGTYSLYQACHEAGMRVFDMKFDQYHTIATALDIEKEVEEEDITRGVTWAAADEERLKSMAVGQQIAHHERPDLQRKAARFPTFGEAIMMARNQMTLFEGVEPTIPQEIAPAAQEKPTKKKETKKKPEPTQTEEVLFPNGNASAKAE